jgi:very-short-patch-repair endonuclease
MEDVPFIGSEALALGRLTRHELRTKFRAIHQDVYISVNAELSPVLRAKACWLRSRRRGVLVGFSASAVHGARWIDNRRAAEISDTNRRPTPGVITRACLLESDELCLKDGLALTTPARTALDLLCWYPTDTAITAVDALARATRLKIADIELLADRYRGRRGIRNARPALQLVDSGAESPKETWLRLVIIRAGFPRPQTQIPVHNEYGVLIAEVDMGYEDLKIAIEYEGAHHRTDRRQFDKDIRRYDELIELGWIVLRFTAEDTPGTVIRKIAAALALRSSLTTGCS